MAVLLLTSWHHAIRRVYVGNLEGTIYPGGPPYQGLNEGVCPRQGRNKSPVALFLLTDTGTGGPPSPKN